MAMIGGRALPLFLMAVMILLVYRIYVDYVAYRLLPEPSSSVDEDEDETSVDEDETSGDGITWALLIAGTSGWYNYRHQADVCHAYQLLKAGGVKDKHIVVFMFDDIAYDSHNMEPGKIFNRFYGHQDVYAGVPKDYTGASVTAENVVGALLGKQKSITGGSGKVIKSRSTDRIFIFISTHGDRGSVDLPNGQTITSAKLLNTLDLKHARNSYKSVVIYIDACHSASMFANVLTPSLNIYAVTSADVYETAYAEYCLRVDGMFKVCLGNLFGISWLEDSEAHNLTNRSLGKQYIEVKKRVSKNGTYIGGSHVMEYDAKHIKSEQLCMYHGFNQKPVNHTRTDPITQRSEHQVWVQVYNHAESKLKCWQYYGR